MTAYSTRGLLSCKFFIMKKKRIVDLSHKLYAGKEEYTLKVKTFFIDELYPQYERSPETWYIMQELTISSHAGTHIEAPYHHLKTGEDVSEIPLERLVGEAIVLDFAEKEPNQAIDVKDLEKYKEKIKPGDIVLIKTGCSKFYGTKKAHERPYLTREATRWFIGKRISCIGIDATGLEIKGAPNQPNHQALFENGIPLIECMANLSELKKERVFLIVLPLKIDKLDSSPVRVIAIENKDE